jgi:hypothetical protein
MKIFWIIWAILMMLLIGTFELCSNETITSLIFIVMPIVSTLAIPMTIISVLELIHKS